MGIFLTERNLKYYKIHIINYFIKYIVLLQKLSLRYLSKVMHLRYVQLACKINYYDIKFVNIFFHQNCLKYNVHPKQISVTII